MVAEQYFFRADGATARATWLSLDLFRSPRSAGLEFFEHAAPRSARFRAQFRCGRGLSDVRDGLFQRMLMTSNDETSTAHQLPFPWVRRAAISGPEVSGPVRQLNGYGRWRCVAFGKLTFAGSSRWWLSSTGLSPKVLLSV